MKFAGKNKDEKAVWASRNENTPVFLFSFWMNLPLAGLPFHPVCPVPVLSTRQPFKD